MDQPRAARGEDAQAALVAAIGADGARMLAQNFGGTIVYVPKNPGDHHPLRVLGDVALAALVESYGGERLAVPKQPHRRARARELLRTGALTRAAIAIETGFSERHLYRFANEGDDGQLDLFEEK